MSLMFLSLGAALLLAPLFNRLVSRAGWVDKPTARKRHRGEIPLSGGLMLVGSVVLLGTVLQIGLPAYGTGLIAGIGLVFAVGFIDDRFPIRARYRLAAQVAAALIAVIWGGALIASFGELLPGLIISPWSWLALLLTVVAIAGLSNAFNLSDGIDGLCASYALVSIGWLLLVTLALDPELVVGLAPLQWLVIGALLAFLVFNLWHPWQKSSAMFLGDGGSVALGFLVAWLAVRLVKVDDGAIGAPVMLWFVAMPMLDMIASLVRRLSEGAKLLAADNRHLHHLLLARGHSVPGAVGILAGAHALAGAVGILAWQLHAPDYLVFGGFVALAAVVCAWNNAWWRRHTGAVKVRPVRGATARVREISENLPDLSESTWLLTGTAPRVATGGPDDRHRQRWDS